MGLEGDARWVLGIMWFMTAIVFFFLLLRLYTRIVCVASYGSDDHIYSVAFVFLLIFTIFTHLAGIYGFGRTLKEIGNMDDAVTATLYECIGQGFAIVGMAIAKWSLGFFLLRIVAERWHKIAIWIAIIEVGLASIAQVLCFWLSCVPLNFVFDRRIPGGYCPIDTRPTSYILCVSTILCDTFFAVFPWIFVWKLSMPRREKLTIAGSLSLGLFAAAAGIKRTAEVEGLYTADYLKDSVGLIIWSAAEMAVTMVCIGIPVCRPLYKRMFVRFRSTSGGSSGGYHKHSEGQSSVALRTFGGGLVDADGRPIPEGKSCGNSARRKNKNGNDDDDADSERARKESDAAIFTHVKLGVKGPFTQTHVGPGSLSHNSADNTSEDEILGGEYRRSRGAHSHEENAMKQAAPDGSIMVTETYRVERS